MSADAYEDCPICLGKGTVRIDYMRDYTLNSDGTITCPIKGHCSDCDVEFKVKTCNEIRRRL